MYKGNKGIAVGGPLAGTMIEAGGTWDGRVEKDLTGLYRWNPLRSRWDWELRETPASRRTGRPHRTRAITPPLR